MSRKWVFLVTVLIIIAAAFLVFNNRYSNQPGNLPEGQVEVRLYFSTQDAMYLQAEERTIPGDDIYRNTLKQLLAGPESSELNRTIPEGVEVEGIEINDGTAYLDFSKELVENHWGGSTGELLTVYSIVNTITQFPEIDRVRILIAGEEVETLVGHMDLTGPLEADQDLIKKSTGR